MLLAVGTVGAIAVAMILYSVLVLLPEVRRAADALRSPTWESPQWVINHTHIEFLTYWRALERVRREPETDLSDLRTRFDIFYSRLEAIGRGQALAELRTIPEFVERADRIKASTEATAAIMDMADTQTRAQLVEMDELATQIRRDVRRLTRLTYDNWISRMIDRRSRLAGLLDMLGVALISGLALLVASLTGLVWFFIISRRQRAALERSHAETIERETALRDSEARFRRAADLANLGHYTWDWTTNQLVSFSDKFAEIHGMTAEEYRAAGLGFDTDVGWVHPEDRERYARDTLQREENYTAFRSEYRIIRRDGAIRHVLDIESGVPDRDAPRPVSEGILLDITDLRLVEEKLRVSEARLREAQSLAKLGHWTVDDQQRLWWSEETYRIFELDPADFDGTTKSFRDRCHPEDLEAVLASARRAWYEQVPYDCVHRILLPDGRVRTVRESAKPIRDAQGTTREFMGTVQDITDQTLAEESLRHAQKMQAIGQLSGGIAHDFNNLLAVIMGNLELLRLQMVTLDASALIDQAILAAQRGGELTRSLLSYAGRARLQPTTFDINSIVGELLGWAGRVMPPNITLTVTSDERTHLVHLDRAQASTALLNLMLNARDAMPEGGSIAISIDAACLSAPTVVTTGTLPPGKYVVVSIRDTGDGIESGDLSKIFEPFFTTKPMDQGTGLGLAMVDGFMRQSGGGVQVDSDRGKGTEFLLYFKESTGPLTVSNMPAGAPGPLPQPALRILLVEDNEPVLTALERILGELGHICISAGSGDEALQILSSDQAFDLILTDSALPGRLQGVDLVRDCRRLVPEIKAVFISGYPTSERESDPRDPWLVKPVRRAVLVTAIQTAMQGP